MLIQVKYIRFFIATALVVSCVMGCSSRRESSGSAETSTTAPMRTFAKTVSSREILPLLNVALNANLGNNNTFLTDFNNLAAALPQNGDSGFSGSVSRLFTNFAKRGCDDAMNREQGIPEQSRVVYRFIDLSSDPSAVTGNDRAQRASAFIDYMAYRAYGIKLPDDERAVLKTFYERQRDLVSKSNVGARELAADICTLILSSPRAIMKK